MVFTFSFVPLQVSRVLYIELLLFLQLWKMQFFFFFSKERQVKSLGMMVV